MVGFIDAEDRPLAGSCDFGATLDLPLGPMACAEGAELCRSTAGKGRPRLGTIADALALDQVSRS